MTDLHISDSLALPLRTVAQKVAILGVSGSGKSYGASVFTEEMLAAGVPVVVFDPLDAWFGLRTSANGEDAGLPIIIAGGSHGDLPLEAGMGRMLADVVVEQRLSMVLSMRHLSKAKQRNLVADFCLQLYHRKGEDQHRTPLHIVIDEADTFVPQRVMGESARVMGAVDDLVRRGRSSGIGVTLICQRAATIHKDVLSQAETLLAFRLNAPQDRKALDAWIQSNDSQGHRDTFLASLASLPTGTCWVWSPGRDDMFEQVTIRPRHTFDSSATPELGQVQVIPQAFASVDLDALRERLASTDAVGDDPVALKREIAELRRQLQERPAPEPVIVEVPVITAENEIVLRDVVAQLTDHGARVYGIRNDLLALLERKPAQHASAPMPPQTPSGAAPPRAEATQRSAQVALHLRKGERSLLQWLVRMGPLARVQLGTLSQYSHTGGTFTTYIGTLRRAGFIVENDVLRATAEGVRFLSGDVLPPPTTRADVAALYSTHLRQGERRLLSIVMQQGTGITREDLGAISDYTHTGGTFTTYLGTLRRNELIEERDGLVFPGPALEPVAMAGAA